MKCWVGYFTAAVNEHYTSHIFCYFLTDKQNFFAVTTNVPLLYYLYHGFMLAQGFPKQFSSYPR